MKPNNSDEDSFKSNTCHQLQKLIWTKLKFYSNPKSMVQWQSLKGYITRNTSAINYENALEIHLSKIPFKSPRDQWVNLDVITYPYPDAYSAIMIPIKLKHILIMYFIIILFCIVMCFIITVHVRFGLKEHIEVWPKVSPFCRRQFQKAFCWKIFVSLLKKTIAV